MIQLFTSPVADWYFHWIIPILDLFKVIYFFSIDSTDEPVSGPKLCRLVNHGRKDKKCTMKVLEVNSKPHLCLFALKNIIEGQEILYDYGIANLSWEVCKFIILFWSSWAKPRPSYCMWYILKVPLVYVWFISYYICSHVTLFIMSCNLVKFGRILYLVIVYIVQTSENARYSGFMLGFISVKPTS